MQNRIREGRCFKVHGTFRKSKASCFSRKIVISFAFIFATACAQLGGKGELLEKNPVGFKNALSQICLSGEGKGRLVFLSERQSFSYESLLESENYTWSLGLEVPMLGQEIFKLHYKNAEQGQIVGEGNLYERLRQTARKEKQSQYHLEILDSYLLSLGQFVLFRTAVLSDRLRCIEETCHFSNGTVMWGFKNDTLVLEFPLKTDSKREKFILEAKDLRNGFYGRLKMKKQDDTHRFEGNRAIEIDLTLNTCSQ